MIEGVTDEESVTLLHAANYFTRSLTLTERAAATRALGVEVERRRAEDDTLTGVRTEDVKAAILQEQTGRKVSGKTIKRQEALAELVETRLIPAWRAKADASLLSASSIETIAALSEEWQVELYDGFPKTPRARHLSRSTSKTPLQPTARRPKSLSGSVSSQFFSERRSIRTPTPAFGWRWDRSRAIWKTRLKGRKSRT